jgi:hypothetical protein
LVPLRGGGGCCCDPPLTMGFPVTKKLVLSLNFSYLGRTKETLVFGRETGNAGAPGGAAPATTTTTTGSPTRKTANVSTGRRTTETPRKRRRTSQGVPRGGPAAGAGAAAAARTSSRRSLRRPTPTASRNPTQSQPVPLRGTCPGDKNRRSVGRLLPRMAKNYG